MEHKRQEMRLMLSRTGVLVVGVTSVVREQGRERVGERESPCVSPRLPPMSHVVSVATSVHDVQRVSTTCLRKALDIPFYRYKEMPICTRGCSYVLSWLAEKRLEPCTRANVPVGEVP
jgi:hypothetical protein